jgi:prevent-host-death family protein
MSMDKKRVPAGEFKQGCLALLDEVAETGAEITITKRGRPVAKLVAIESASQRERAALARLRRLGSKAVLEEASVLKPSSTLGEWRALTDD